MLSEIARGVFPAGSTGAAMYYVVQGTTLAILIFAANTSYQGFPRLAALLARDRFFPRQFVNLGDRLVYSNGIVVLTGLAAALIVVFQANVNSLIHLYVIGVFTAFTLSQAGMVRYWRRTRGPGWRRRAVINGIGAAATGIVTLLVIQTKFTEGAWAVMVAIPVLVLALLRGQAPLPADRSPAARGGDRDRVGSAADEHRRPLRRGLRRGDAARELVRARDRGRTSSTRSTSSARADATCADAGGTGRAAGR